VIKYLIARPDPVASASSAIFGGNARENATAGITSAATYYIGHEGGFTDGERYLLHGALTSQAMPLMEAMLCKVSLLVLLRQGLMGILQE